MTGDGVGDASRKDNSSRSGDSSSVPSGAACQPSPVNETEKLTEHPTDASTETTAKSTSSANSGDTKTKAGEATASADDLLDAYLKRVIHKGRKKEARVTAGEASPVAGSIGSDGSSQVGSAGEASRKVSTPERSAAGETGGEKSQRQMGASATWSEKFPRDARQRKDRGKAAAEAAAGGDGGGGKGTGGARAGKGGVRELGATGGLDGTGASGSGSGSGAGNELRDGAEGGRDDAFAHGQALVHRHEHKHGHEGRDERHERHERHEQERHEHAHGFEHGHRHGHGDKHWSGEEKKEEGAAAGTAAAGSASGAEAAGRVTAAEEAANAGAGAEAGTAGAAEAAEAAKVEKSSDGFDTPEERTPVKAYNESALTTPQGGGSVSSTPDRQRFGPSQGQRFGSSQRGALFESPQMQGRPRGGEISADEHADDEGSEGGSEGEEDDDEEEEEGSEEEDDDFDNDDDYSTTDTSTGSDYTEDEDEEEEEEEEEDEQSSIVSQAKAQRAEAERLAAEAAAEARAREREGSAVRVARAAVVERSQLVGVLEGERREAEARMREAAEQHRTKSAGRGAGRGEEGGRSTDERSSRSAQEEGEVETKRDGRWVMEQCGTELSSSGQTEELRARCCFESTNYCPPPSLPNFPLNLMHSSGGAESACAERIEVIVFLPLLLLFSFPFLLPLPGFARIQAEELRARVRRGFEAVTAESLSHAATRKERAAREAHYETEAASGMAALAAAQRALEEKVELLASDWSTVHRLTEEIEQLEQRVQRAEAEGEGAGAAEEGAEVGRGAKGREEEGAAANVGGEAAAGEGAAGRHGAAEGAEGAGLGGDAGGGSDGGGTTSVGLLEGTLRQRRKEVALLRQQLEDAESAAAQQQTESEVESNLLSRLQQLTERLILKQQQVESLQIEKSTLSLRIETESAALQKDKHRLSTFLRSGRNPASAAVTARFLASTPGPLAADLAAAASAAEARALEEGGEEGIEGDPGFSREAILNRSRKLTLAQRDFGLGPTGNAIVVGVVDMVLGFDSLFLGSAGGVLRTNVVARTSLWVYLVVLHLWVAFVWLMHFPFHHHHSHHEHEHDTHPHQPSRWW
ncbi:unnamed protein product [Closterium sp. NIES-53]